MAVAYILQAISLQRSSLLVTKHRWKSVNYYEIQSALMAVLTYCDYR